MSMLDKLVAHDPSKPFIGAAEFARRTQKLFDEAYPLRCTACGRREEKWRPVTLSDGKTAVTGAYCPCGAYKGPVAASPMETYRAMQEVHALPRGTREQMAESGPAAIGSVAAEALRDESTIPRRPATPTSVAMSAEPAERPRPNRTLTPEERMRFMSRAAALGCDEHRLRADLAAHGEEPEECTLHVASAVIRELEAEREEVAS